MDAGIIHSFKANYKRLFCRHLIRQFDEGNDARDIYMILICRLPI